MSNSSEEIKELIEDAEEKYKKHDLLEEEYRGDIIRIDKLTELLPTEHWEWDDTGVITLDDVSIALHNGLTEIPDPYGDVWNHPVLEMRSRDWHIGRILYFIKHPNEIRDIEIDNECSYGYILPQPVIVDGWHRYAAARWLYDQEKLLEIHCRYGGRMDVLEYLQGNNESLLGEVI